MHYPLIGILGGTFNPIHFGHLRTAQEVAESINLKAVKFIPSANPPHKPKPVVSATQRTKMVELAIKSNPLFNLDTIELNRTGPSYTIDTLKNLYSQNANAALCLIMGTDAFIRFDTWHQWSELINYCHIVLVQRQTKHSQSGLPATLESFLKAHYIEEISLLNTKRAGYICMQQIRLLEISSSDIRDLTHAKKSTDYLTTVEVINYIKNEKLYI